eukprot:7274937-Pyramimonas_sp.AAC.1
MAMSAWPVHWKPWRPSESLPCQSSFMWKLFPEASVTHVERTDPKDPRRTGRSEQLRGDHRHVRGAR